MSFSYYDKNNITKNIDIKVGMNWSNFKTDNEKINSIFSEVDDGDGIVQFVEKMMFENILKTIDNLTPETSNNKILDANELDIFNLEADKLRVNFNKNNFSLSNIKANFSSAEYEITEENNAITVKDKKSGNTILSASTSDSQNLSITEYTSKGGAYKVTANNHFQEIKHHTNPDSKDYNKRLGFSENKLYNYKNNALEINSSEMPMRILETKLKNPRKIDESTLQTLLTLDKDKLLDLMNSHLKNNKKYLLDEIAASTTIPDDRKYDYLANILIKLEKDLGCKEQFELKNQRIDNEFYTSDHTYDVKYDYDTITIKQHPKEDSNEEEIERTIDVNKLMKKLPIDLIPLTRYAIQHMPAEALMDLAVECDSLESPNNKSKKIGTNIAGIFDIQQDAIYVGFKNLNRPDLYTETLIHELGHAIDVRATHTVPPNTPSSRMEAETLKLYSITSNKEFNSAYLDGKYRRAGFDKYGERDSQTGEWKLNEAALKNNGYLDSNGNWTSKATNTLRKAYMYTDPYGREGFSEAYLYAMTGHSSNTDKNAITKEQMTATKNCLTETRMLKDEERHIKQF